MKQPFLWIPKEEMPLYMQLYQCIRKSILEGGYEPNQKMPSIRLMAKTLDISKTTVETAYQQLLVEGYLRGVEKVGYFVEPMEEEGFSGKEMPIAEFSELHFPTYINTDVDQESFDMAVWKRYLNKSITLEEESLYGYGNPQGEEILREALAGYVRDSRGVLAKKEQIVIGAGTQQLLFVLAEILKEEYGEVVFETPIFAKAKHIFDAMGYDIEHLEKDGDYFKEAKNKKLLYVSPSHQFPFAQTMSIAKRFSILSWAKKTNSIIIEDDYDGELRYQGHPVPSLQGLDKGEHVVYLGALSKILLPSIRISFMVLPPQLVCAYQKIISHYSQTASQIEQITLANFIADGSLERHVRKIRKMYAKKSKHLTDSLRERLGSQIQILASDTGLYILFQFSKGEMGDSFEEYMATRNIKIISYSYFLLGKEKEVFLLPFGGLKLEEIPFAVSCIEEFLKEKKSEI